MSGERKAADPGSPRDRRIARLAEIDPRPEILSLGPDQLEATLATWLGEHGEPRYRTDQIIDWIYRRRAGSWEAMTTLPKALRADLDRAFRFPSIALEEERVSADGTRKILWRLVDGEAV